ncbi:hypothetical protein GJAV_G00191950 [Gymnothorax javanicus]|nr:hypothetical protein GJAV_G00191950 [Gymnothorax javanicus]
MMAVRERASTAMAALDRRIASLDDFVGQSWSSWIDRAGIFVSEGCEAEDCGKNGKNKVETMTLRKEDMFIFGHCPAHDDFYLVVCSHCGQVVKPQAFEKHCETRHGPLGKLYSRLHPSPSGGALKPRPGHTPSRPGHAPSPRSTRDSRPAGTGPPRLTPPLPLHPLPQHRPSKLPKEGSGFSPADEVSQTPPPPDPPPFSPPPSSQESPRPPQAAPSPSEKPLPRRGELGRPPDFPSPRTYSKTYKRVTKKECNLDKHCGVLDTQRKRLCTRLLTCNIHSIHQRRQVSGRSRSFDQLVAELKMGSRVRERSGPAREGLESGSLSPDLPLGQTGSPVCKRRLVNCVTARSRTPSGSGAEEGELCEEEHPPHLSAHPSAQSRLSSEESEGEGPDEPPDLPATHWHPKPLALCSFGSRALGHGVFTFDRRLHHLRSALNTMVEHHLNAHLWKKIPQTADLQSPRTSATLPYITSPYFNSQHSRGRGAGPHGTISSLRTSASSSSLGRRKPSSVDHSPSPSPSPSPARDRNCSPHERGRPPASSRTTPSPHGPINGTLSPGSKPPRTNLPSPEPRLSKFSLHLGHSRASPPNLTPPPPSDPSSRGRGGGPGPHRKALSYDHKSLGKKRKSNPPPPLAPPRTSKISRLSAATHSGFFSWKKDGRVGGASGGMGKGLSAQKPKLHH